MAWRPVWAKIVYQLDCLSISPSSHNIPFQRVGFVGIGAMGDPMSTCVAMAGVETLIADADASRAASLAADGRRRAVTLAELGTCDAVVLMLPDSNVVEAVLLADGLLDRLQPGSVLLDMSSSDPRHTRALGARVAEREVAFADAPVSGGVARARTGELTVMVGADGLLFDRIKPLLSTMAANVFHVGDLGSGHAAKALNNLLSATGLLVAIEAVEAARRFGLDPVTLLELVNVSTGMNHATKTKIERYVLSETFDSGFRARLMLKDLRTARALCEEMGLGTGLAAAVAETWATATEQLGEGADQTEVYRVTAGSTKSERSAA